MCNRVLSTTHLTPSNGESAVEIPLKPYIGPGGVKRLPSITLVRGFLSGNTLTFNFISSTPAATITISNQLTGEVEYTEICNTQSTVIDLSMLAFNGFLLGEEQRYKSTYMDHHMTDKLCTKDLIILNLHNNNIEFL